MSTIFYRSETGQERAPPRRRAVSFLLALAIEVLLLLAFFTLNFRDKPKPEFRGGAIATFDLSADSQTDRSNMPEKQEQELAETRQPSPATPVPKPEIKLPPRPLQMIEVTPETYRASDIAKLGNAAPGAEQQVAGGRVPGDSEMVGTAPNGEPLYAAEWYREPTNAELSAYLPKSVPEGGGWGLVACKTAERFRVEDCVELGQAPAGSHLAGAVRQAAWQFLVRPPRVGGKSMVGTWVRIRIDYSFNRAGSD